MRFEFVVKEGREAGRRVALATGQALTFGRLQTCDVPLDDESVSRRHCTLHARQDGCVVADLQSVNGTFVNDVRVASAHLRPGDKLRVGSTVVELVSALAPDTPTAGWRTTASLNLVAETRGQTVVRRAVDPTKLQFLTKEGMEPSERAPLESAQCYLATLQNVSKVLSRATGVEALFDSVLSAILDVTKGDRAAILMHDVDVPTNRGIRVAAMRTRTGDGNADTMVLSQSVVQDVLDHGVSTFSHDALHDERYGRGASIVRQRIRSVMCAPMRTTEEILGVLYVDSRSAHEFSDAQLELLAAIGNQAGTALHRTRLLTEVEKLFLDVMRAIAAIIDAKDGYTHRHSERVAALAVRIAEQLGWAAEECRLLELSGLLHDVGKIGVSDAILRKPGRLTEEEFTEVRRHPGHGAAILSHIQSAKIARLLPGVMYHHERWDGGGYPDGLTGHDIPLFGRVLAVADFIDALTSDRAYRPARSIDAVVAMIQEESGRAFDPRVVEAAVTLHEKGELALPFTAECDTSKAPNRELSKASKRELSKASKRELSKASKGAKASKGVKASKVRATGRTDFAP